MNVAVLPSVTEADDKGITNFGGDMSADAADGGTIETFAVVLAEPWGLLTSQLYLPVSDNLASGMRSTQTPSGRLRTDPLKPGSSANGAPSFFL